MILKLLILLAVITLLIVPIGRMLGIIWDSIPERGAFDPKKSFFKLPIVQFTLYIVLIISIAAGYDIYDTTGFPNSVGPQFYKELVSTYSFPLSLVALLIPLLGLFVTEHKSRQNVEQLKLSKSQSDFNNYYKHIEEFEKHLAHNGLNETVEFRKLHVFLFSGSRNGNYTINTEVYSEINDTFGKAYQYLNSFSAEEELVDAARILSTVEIEQLITLIDELDSFFKRVGVSGDRYVYVNTICKEDSDGFSVEVDLMQIPAYKVVIELLTCLFVQSQSFKIATDFDFVTDTYFEFPFYLKMFLDNSFKGVDKWKDSGLGFPELDFPKSCLDIELELEQERLKSRETSY